MPTPHPTHTHTHTLHTHTHTPTFVSRQAVAGQTSGLRVLGTGAGKVSPTGLSVGTQTRLTGFPGNRVTIVTLHTPETFIYI